MEPNDGVPTSGSCVRWRWPDSSGGNGTCWMVLKPGNTSDTILEVLMDEAEEDENKEAKNWQMSANIAKKKKTHKGDLGLWMSDSLVLI